MNVTTRHIEGMTAIPGAAGATPMSAIAIPLLPTQGSWVITGTVQAVSADGLHGPVVFFPRFTGICAGGLAIPNSTGAVATEPEDGGEAQSFAPARLSLVSAEDQGVHIAIALTGMAGVAIYWAWALDITSLATP